MLAAASYFTAPAPYITASGEEQRAPNNLVISEQLEMYARYYVNLGAVWFFVLFYFVFKIYFL